MANRTSAGALGALSGGLSGLGASQADQALGAVLNSYQLSSQLVPSATASSGCDGMLSQGLLPLGANRPTPGAPSLPLSAPYPISSAAEDAMAASWAHPALSGMS